MDRSVGRGSCVVDVLGSPPLRSRCHQPTSPHKIEKQTRAAPVKMSLLDAVPAESLTAAQVNTFIIELAGRGMRNKQTQTHFVGWF